MKIKYKEWKPIVKGVSSIILAICVSLSLQNGALTEVAVKEIASAVTSNMEWKVEIPVINLSAQIANGTDEEIMNKYVGHFEETVNIIGNVGLAAHNRGYPVNYFKNLKDLKLEDEIYYTYLGKKRKYKIDKIEVIQDTNWKPLENTKQNRITLITCIANKPEYRLCIQALELGGKNEN
mgnify:FL=1